MIDRALSSAAHTRPAAGLRPARVATVWTTGFFFVVFVIFVVFVVAPQAHG
jgi:hypothetical protein